MNLEPRVMSKGLWWDEHCGGVCKDSKFAMLYHKPNISAVIAEYDAVSCYPKAGPEANIVVINGVTRALNQAEISGIDANMVGSQDVQMRITPVSAPAGFDMTSVTFGKVGWGTTYSLTSCAAKNPDLVSF